MEEMREFIALEVIKGSKRLWKGKVRIGHFFQVEIPMIPEVLIKNKLGETVEHKITNPGKSTYVRVYS